MIKNASSTTLDLLSVGVEPRNLFCFRMILNSHTVLRNDTKKSSVHFSQFFPNSNIWQNCTIISQQDTDTDAILWFTQICPFSRELICVHMLCEFSSVQFCCVCRLCVRHHSWDMEEFPHWSVPSYLFIATPTSLPRAIYFSPALLRYKYNIM